MMMANARMVCRRRLPARIHRSLFHSSSYIGIGSGFQLPEPTWSLQELHLTSATPTATSTTNVHKETLSTTTTVTATSTTSMAQATAVSRDQLRILAKRAVLDLDQLPDDQIEVLRNDVEHMLHMMQVVETYSIPLSDDMKMMMTPEVIYDVPRGVNHAPLRHDKDDRDDDSLLEQEEQDAKEVWNSLLQPKTVKLGGHSYFRIVTKSSLAAPAATSSASSNETS